MDILRYNELDTSRVQKQYEKIVEMIQRDDFYSAEVKKLAGTPYYRAKLDHTNRLLFKIITYNDKKYALLLEIIYSHAYEKSRFLNGAKIDESKIEQPIIDSSYLDKQPVEIVPYLNQNNVYFHILDKIISFDQDQDEIFRLMPPLIIIGSAGSGKTMLTLEKMKTYSGEILYVTSSSYLIQNAHNLYYANHYTNENQEIDFLSYREFLETIKVPAGKEVNFQAFSVWLRQAYRSKIVQDPNKLYEEFKGVITGNSVKKRCLSEEEYSNLGIKQSIFSMEERPQVYELFEKYLTFLKDNQFYDSNLISFDYLPYAAKKYDFIVIDEVQDLTPIQLFLILQTLKQPQNFMLCGDSNQIVHPNFFSWAKLKTLFYHQTSGYSTDIIRILHKNYRNTHAVTSIANKILKIKNARFGSIDKESHYLVDSQCTTKGEIYCLLNHENLRQEINQKTHKSTHFAVIVLREEQKEEVSRYFQTPLIFSIYEAKGLEYDNVILYNFVSSDEKKFRDIAQGVTIEDVMSEFTYGRVKDKSDRSLEIYKFYINALYVAITRAVKNVYWIETLEQHSLLYLLDLKPTAELLAIEGQESSTDEWQKEMRRLEMQGKQAQADAIRHTILHTQSVPWQVITPSSLISLQEKALDVNKKDKDARLLLFEYALVYQQPTLFELLKKVNFAPAFKPDKGYDLLERKYFMGYNSENTTIVMRQIALYGVDFRTQFNQTPLMVASSYGNEALIRLLMIKGANAFLVDNLGRNAFQVALHRALVDKRFAQYKLASLYQNLLADNISLQVESKLVKIDVQRMEFFLINAMIAIAHQKRQRHHSINSFRVDDFLLPLANFPEIVMPERRKRRAYISSILAKNEIHRQDIYNRKLFMRVRHGYYILNPDLLIMVNDKWENLYQLLGLEQSKKNIYQGHDDNEVAEQC